jgi:hypothetical protein
MIKSKNSEQKGPKDEGDGSNRAHVFPAWARAMKHDQQSEEQKHKSAERCHWTFQNWAQGITVIFSGIALGGALASAYFAHETFVEAQRQANAAKDQVDIMRDQNRPWIRADISFARPIRFTQWAGRKHINVSLTFDLKNFGQSPATNIRIFTHVQPHPGNAQQGVLDTDQQTICNQARETAERDKTGGIAAFPQEPKVVENGGGTGGLYETQNNVIFSINGCIDYTYADNRHGQTGFRKTLGKVNGNIVDGIPFPVVVPEPNWLPPSPELLASGYPPDRPLVGYVRADDLWFHDDDNGNYAK